MRRTKIKICGMLDPQQVQTIVGYGVDAIGMIFHEKSPRNISIQQAQEIRKNVPAFVSLVGVFVKQTPVEINQIASEVGLDLVQLHGDQNVAFANQVNFPYVKVIRVKSIEDISDEQIQHPKARAYLLDTYEEGLYGGTGTSIKSSLLPEQLPERTMLAGGLNAENIDTALKFQPYAIDLNSGVEVSPGNKDLNKVKHIVDEIRKFDAEYTKS